MKLIELSCRNFKGLKEFSFTPEGKDAEISGPNASGKTTIADAFFYLVNGKDSMNRADFEIKTIDPKTQGVKHNLDHEVEALILTDKEIRLKKVYREVWTKTRGSAKSEFSGHTTDYFIDGVDKPKSDFDALLEDIAPQSVFRLLTDPRYFNEVMPWKTVAPKKGKPTIGRRDLLIETFGDVSDEEIIEKDFELSGLTAILGERSIDDHRKVIRSRQTVINDQLLKLPVRIDEVNRNLPDVSDLNKLDLEKTLDGMDAEISELESEKARVENSGQDAELQKKLRYAESVQIDAANKSTKELNVKIGNMRKEKSFRVDHETAINSSIERKQDDVKNNSAEIVTLNTQRDNLLTRYYEIKAEDFDPSGLIACEECGHINGAESAEKHFNQGKAQLLEENKAKGLAVKSRIETLTETKDQWVQEIASLEGELVEAQAKIKALDTDIQELETIQPEACDTQRVDELKEQIAKLKAGGGPAKIQEIAGRIHGINVRKKDVEETFAAFKAHEKANARISELEAEQKTLAAEFEKLESEYYLTDLFTRAKVRVLEERINDKFKYCQFKLFEIQVNGNLNECCIAMVDGVPYSSMNNSARINCGLDIINTFNGVLGFSAPIFVDNSEAVNDLFPMDDAQVIKLTVAKNKKLKIETQKETEKNDGQ